MAYPFPRLKTEGFWHLVPNPGFEAKIDMDFSSMSRLRQVCASAKMDEELFGYLCNPETKERLRAVLINTYFVPEIRPLVEKQGKVNYDAYQYSQTLLKMAEPEVQYGEGRGEDDFQERVRDQGFRKATSVIYFHPLRMLGGFRQNGIRVIT